MTWNGEVLMSGMQYGSENGDGTFDFEIGDWVEVGAGFRRAYVQKVPSWGQFTRAAIVGLRDNGETWITFVHCADQGCGTSGWANLGGNVTQLRVGRDHLLDCIRIAGLAPSGNVYEARSCTDASNSFGWRSAGGRLQDLGGLDDGDLYGVTGSGQLWYRPIGGGWKGAGGNVTSPAQHLADDGYCGLSPSRAVWCYDLRNKSWRSYGGDFKHLDDSSSIGVSANDQVGILHGESGLRNLGGQVTQVAFSNGHVVAVAPSGSPWIRRRGVSAWERLE